MEKKKAGMVFQNRVTVIILAITCSIAWAFAFPLIKLGTAAFQIDAGDVGAKNLYAGIRFLFAGITVILFAKATGHSISVKKTADRLLILIFGLVNTTLHYFCFYMGLSVQSGSRSAIIDSMSSFILIVLACICFKAEKMTVRKVIGCLLGIIGIVFVNIGGNDSPAGFTFMGDGMLMLSAFFSALGGILTRIVTRRTDPVAATGYSLAFGGGIMVFAGILSGAKLEALNGKGILYLILLIAISVYGFTVYNQLLCYNPVGEIAIFNALIPILGVIFSSLLLGEPFKIQYIAAGAVVALGVYIINRKGANTEMLQSQE